jgi:hypothetical protein
MKNTIILILALIFAACATANPKTEAEWNQFFSEKQNADVIEAMRYESLCNQLVFMHIFGEIVRILEEKAGTKSEDGMVQEIGRQFSRRSSNSQQQQEAFYEMFDMGYRKASFFIAHSPEMNQCLKTDYDRMMKYRELKMKQILEAYDKQNPAFR